MNDVRHVITDTMELIEYIKSFDVNANTWMLKADVKDFFLTGSEDELVRSAVSLVELRMKVPLARAVEFLLWSQFVRSIHHPNRLWKTVKGSGMGLPHSGEVADAMLLVRERAILRQFTPRGYVRFKDDILILIDDDGNGSVGKFWYGMKAGLKPFVIKPDSISQTDAMMLDIHIYRINGTTKLGYEPAMKVTGLGHVLNPTSYHHDAIHYNWPLAEARRIQKRSGSSVAFNKALMKFAERLNRFNIDDDVVKLVKTTP